MNSNLTKKKRTIKDRRFGTERALYALRDAKVVNCRFEGPEDGESALKESRGVAVENCSFSLRYPFWHAREFSVKDCTFDAGVRAPVWYASGGSFKDCRIEGVKCLRESKNVSFERCSAVSDEFGWRCDGVVIRDSYVESMYFLFESRNVSVRGLRMKGKYSFQYVENMVIDDSELDTKDAFWHTKNVTVRNTVIKGEYLGWYSEGLTLIGCRISGTQPFCYCSGLKLIGCTMDGCDLSFEYSDVEADIGGCIDSVKNPRSGHITADSIGEIIRSDSVMPCECVITERTKGGKAE